MLRIPLEETEVDWYCGRTRKQGHRIQLETSQTCLLLKLDNEIDAHSWYQSLQKTVQAHKTWILNNPRPSTTENFISGPSNVVKTSPEHLIKQLAQSPPPQSTEIKQQNFKLGRKGEKFYLELRKAVEDLQDYPNHSEEWPLSCEEREVMRKTEKSFLDLRISRSKTPARGK